MILVWGGGAIGGTLAAYWARAGLPVTMVDIEPAHVAAASSSGIAIEGPVESFVAVVPSVTPERLSGRFEHVVLAVKAHMTEAALEMLAPHLADDGYVLSAQNGLNELAIARRVGSERTMGCFVNFGADWLGPGRILYGNRGTVAVGEIDGSVRDRTRRMHKWLRLFEPDAILTGNIHGYLWGKLAYGALLFATALTADSMSRNFGDARRHDVFVGLAREVIGLALARGLDPVGFGRFDPRAFDPAAGDGTAAAATMAWLAHYTAQTAKTHSGIWRDLAVRRRPTEVDAQIGVLVGLAREQGREVPLLSRLVDLIHDVENGRRAQSLETFERMRAE